MTRLWRPTLGADGLPAPRIFLSASVPSLQRDQRFLSGPAEPRRMALVIENRVRDAVASFVAQLLRCGGQLIFGGHPAIIRKVADAAQDFERGSGENYPVVLYQSQLKLFLQQPPPVGREEMEGSRIAKVVWVPADPEEAAEKFHIKHPFLLDRGKFEELSRRLQFDMKAPPEVPPALVVLRVVMFLHSAPHAILSMGGMEGIGAEAHLFRELHAEAPSYPESRFFQALGSRRERPTAFALKSTFGAAQELDAEATIFIDERRSASETSFTASRAESAEAPLEPSQDLKTIEQQLPDRVRYDRIMQDFVQGVASAVK